MQSTILNNKLTKETPKKSTATSAVIDTTGILGWASFDYHMCRNCMTQITTIASIVKDLITVGRGQKVNLSWSQRESYVTALVADATENNKLLDLLYGSLSKDKDINEVRRVASRINSLTSEITRGLYELRLVEDEIIFVLKGSF
jgi:hypothetical protein